MNIFITGPDSKSVEILQNLFTGHPKFTIVEPNLSHLIFKNKGLLDLYNTIANCYHVNSASKSIREFKRFSRSILDSDEHFVVDNFLKKIIAVEYEGMPFCDRSELNPLQTILFERKRRKAKAMKRKPKMGSMYIPVDISSFTSSCRDFLDQLIKNRSGQSDKYNLIHVDGTHSMTQSLSKIFSKSKIIYLNHDPRNLFSIFKKRKNPWLGKKPEDFSNWFKQNNRVLRAYSAGSKTTFIISYEEIIADTETSLKKMWNFLEVNSKFMDIDDINNNVYDSVDWYKKVLTKSELQTIEHHCTGFLNPEYKLGK